jgi:2-polyprenyl-6-methoxyphenol hydroxylase-like FAD-dependent oxidoreductase
MSHPENPLHFDVIIVGGGPTGAALAGDLGQRGISVLLLEQTDGVVRDARLHAVSIRTMELARRWGIEDELRHCGWPLDHPQDVVWGTSLSEPEIARIHWPPISEMTPPAVSPTFAQRCPQMWFNAILLRFAARQPSVTTLLRSKVVDVTQNTDIVTVRVHYSDGRTATYTADYLVAADGARSDIRRNLGIDTEKSSVWGTSAEAIVRSPQLRSLPLAQTLGRFTVLEPAGMSISLLPFDGKDQYRITVMVGDGDVTERIMLDAGRKIAGVDVDIEFVTEILPWSNRETIAAAFREGRIFLAGDAAHTMPTTGGLGMNTGIQDSFDLAWKLDAVLRGWAGDRLLDSYDPERRAAAKQSSALASGIYQDWVQTRHEHQQFWSRILSGGTDADRAREQLGASLVQTFRREFNNIPASLGYRYEGSPVCVPDGTDTPALTFDEYVPTARPGHRAPHVWTAPGVSTLDLFGPNFTLLAVGHDKSAGDALVIAARERNMPLTVAAVTEPDIVDAMRSAYERRLVLVRPDGHVAWRGDHVPANPGRILDIARGATNIKAPSERRSATMSGR